MASEALFQALAQALSQPSKAYRAAQAGLEIPENALKGYLQGDEIASKFNERKRLSQTLQQALGGSVPSEVSGYKNIPVATLKDLGGLDAISKFGKVSEDYLTPDQASKFGVDQPFIQSFGGKPIPRQVAQGYVSNKSRGQIAGALDKRNEVNVANAINKNVNSLTSGSGALSLAGKNNLRIARVKSLLERPTPLTPAEFELVTTDLAGIVQGGVPLKDTVEGQQISTVATKMANLLKTVTNNPQVFNDSGFRSRIIQLSNEMIAADNQVQNKAFQMVKANFGHLTTPEHLDRVFEAIKNGEQLPVMDPQGPDLSNIPDEALRAIAGSSEQ